MKRKAQHIKRYCFSMKEGSDYENLQQQIHSLKKVVIVREVYTWESGQFIIYELASAYSWEDLDVNNIALKRCFKKPPGIINISKSELAYKRTVMTLELKNDLDLLEEYKDIHTPEKIWPEIIQNMDDIGVVDMEIYLDGYRAYLIMDTLPSFDRGRDGEKWTLLPREKEWQAYVSKFQKTDPESKAMEKWKTMAKI